MKRLFSITSIFALLIATSLSVLDAKTASAAPLTASVDAKTMAGMTVAALESQYGPAVRMEPSEYGFTWYVYNRDYENYFLAGVRDGQVVAVYTTAASLRYGSDFELNSTKTAVRSRLGEPLAYVRSGSTVAVLPDRDQKDVFAVGSNYVIVFYDVVAGGKVTSVMVLPQEDGLKTFTGNPPLTPSLAAAYQRISVDLVNAARARHGLNILTVDALDTNLAIARSNDMVARNYFDHYTPENRSPADLAREMGLSFTTLGENIAYGNSNAMMAHEAFMNSSGHRSNVLKSPYTKIGAGVAYGGSRYVILTNIFSNNTAGPAAPAPAPPIAHDVNGDGIVSISDYTLVRLSILGIRPLTGSEIAAADANGDGAVSITDYTLIRLEILGIGNYD